MKLEARIESLYIGRDKGVEKTPVDIIQVNLEGFAGDRHSGFARASRKNPDTLVRNDRQWSAISLEELASIAEAMGIPKIDPAWLGANLALSGIPNLTRLPKGTELIFPRDAVLLIEGENRPCTGPGKVISLKYPDLKINPSSFPKAAIGKRGLVGVVDRPGIITIGEVVIVNVYEPTVYSLPPNL